MSQPLTAYEIECCLPSGASLNLFGRGFSLLDDIRDGEEVRDYGKPEPTFGEYYWDQIHVLLPKRAPGTCAFVQREDYLYVEVRPPVLQAIILIASNYLALRGHLEESGKIDVALKLAATCLKARWDADQPLASPPSRQVV